MNLSQILVGIAALIAAGGQFADAFTTYIGVTVKKIAVEGNKNFLTSWLVAHPRANMAIKTAYPLAIGAWCNGSTPAQI